MKEAVCVYAAGNSKVKPLSASDDVLSKNCVAVLKPFDEVQLVVGDCVVYRFRIGVREKRLSGREEAGLGEAFSCGRVGVGAAGEIYEDATTIGAKIHTVGENEGIEEMEDQLREAKNRFQKGLPSSDETEVDDAEPKDKEDFIEDKRAQLRERKLEIAKRHAALLKKILRYEKDLKMQEKKREQEAGAAAKESSPSQLVSITSEGLSKDLSSSTSPRDLEATRRQTKGTEQQLGAPERSLTLFDAEVPLSAAQRREMLVADLKEKSYTNKRRTQESKSSVQNYTAYKEHVMAARKLWQCDAAGGPGDFLTSHFRDHLMLRYELLVKIYDATEYLRALKQRFSEAQQREEQREEQELTQLHQTSSAERESDRQLQEAESQLMQLQAVSTKLSSQLTQVRMAITNMYSIARRFRKSIPPLQILQSKPEHRTNGEENIDKMLELLKHFLEDTQTAVALAGADITPDSAKPTFGSHH
ncbi:hypothetical protein FHG87_009803 [Trinorchestia longiramus]|nr:hypothetical protein FHG87_009803 [Trinorchestia longiramus]